MRDGKHDLTVIYENVTPYNNHVPVEVLFQMFLLLRIILRKRETENKLSRGKQAFPLFFNYAKLFGQRSTNFSTSGHPGWNVFVREKGKWIRNEEPVL